MLLRPLSHISGSFAGVTPPAKELEIAGVIRSPSGDCKNVVDLQSLLSFAASGANTILAKAKCFHVVDRVDSAVLCEAHAPLVLLKDGVGSDVLDVCGLPCGVSNFNSIKIFDLPSLHLSAMSGRIGGASAPRAGGHVPRISFVPFLASLDRTLDADAIGDEFFVVSMPARLADRVVQLAGRTGRNAIRMLGLLGLRLERVDNGARSADATSRVPLADVSVPARFAGMVKSFACRACGFSLWNSAHRSSGVSDMLIAHPA